MVAARVTTGLAGRVARACIAALFRDKSLPTPRSRYTPRQNSPSTAKIARFGLFWARWAKNFAFATRALPAGRIFSRRPQPTSRAGYPHRYKTLPAHGVHELNRYKTLPASRKTPISALLTRAGRKLSRSGRKLPEQGELFPADHHPLAAQRTLTGTKLSPHTACMAATGTKLSPHTACVATTGTKLSQHREKRTFQPIRGEQGENYPGRDANNRRRESFIPQWWQCFLSTMSVGQPRHHRFHPTETCRQPKHHRFLAACTHPTDAQCARLPQNRMQFPHPPNAQRLKTLEYQ